MKMTDRVVGYYTHRHRGPFLLITAGIHGNEPAGVKALQKVFKTMRENEMPVRGAVAGIIGNLQALNGDVRYKDEDMNRIWADDRLDHIKGSGSDLNAEEKEAAALLGAIEDMNYEKYPERYQVDLHTTSSESIPYISVSRRSGCLAFANTFPLHDVTGFSELVPGTIDHWFCRHGFNGFTVEAGQHRSKTSRENCEAIIWMALVESGCMDMDDIGRYKISRDRLSKYILDEKKNFHIEYRFPIEKGDVFQMEPGFVNFQHICEGELLAHVNGKAIYSEWNARILMPLYQSQGEDGFFVIKEISPPEHI